MADSASSILLTREQSTGSNTNTWGGYLIVTQRMTEQAMKGYQSLAVTGDATISWTNYTTGNTGSCARLKLTGTLTAAATLTFPNVHNELSVHNATTGGYSVTIKCSGGTGVAITNGNKAQIYCDGTDYYNKAPTIYDGGLTVAGQIHGLTAGSSATDAVNKTQMETAIATAGLPATSGTILISSLDTTANFAANKLIPGYGVDITDSGAGNASLTFNVNTNKILEFISVTGTVTATLSSGTTPMTAKRRYRISSTATGTLPTMVAGDYVIVEFTVGAGVVGTVGRNGQTIDGAAADDTYTGTGSQGPVIRYEYSGAGAVSSRLIEGISA